MSAIGAGLTSPGSTEQTASTGYQSIEDIASKPVAGEEKGENLVSPAPKDLSKIILTDYHENLLGKCMDNLQAACFPVSKAEVAYLDWKTRLPHDMKDQFDFIIGCECAYYYPLMEPLARTIAYGLKSSPYDRKENEQLIRGKFLHFGPDHREAIGDLKRKLAKGYRMNTRKKEIVLERVDLVPLILDSLDEAESQLKEEIEGESGGYVEYQNMATSKYCVLVGYHHEDYDGSNGDFFFPHEKGTEDRYGDSGLEVDYGTEAGY